MAGEAEAIAGAEQEARTAAEAQRTLEAERDRANEAFVEVLTDIAKGEDRLAAIADRREEMIGAVQTAFSREMQAFTWFTETYVRQVVEQFMGRFDQAFERWRREYAALSREREEINRRLAPPNNMSINHLRPTAPGRRDAGRPQGLCRVFL